MPDAQIWIDALQSAQDHFVEIVQPLSEAEVKQPAYPEKWSIADTASHLGSQSEIMGLYSEAGLTGGAVPGMEIFQPIWDRWNALPPTEQVRGSIAATETFVTPAAADLPQRAGAVLGGPVRRGCRPRRPGRRPAGRARRAHWDIAVALDPAAVVAAAAVELLVDRLPGTVAFAGKAVEGADPVAIRTTGPERSFRLTLSPAVALEPADDPGPDPLVLPAEALLRLVYGRLDLEHTPVGVNDPRLVALREAFRGL